jgi:hypothetical protein
MTDITMGRPLRAMLDGSAMSWSKQAANSSADSTPMQATARHDGHPGMPHPSHDRSGPSVLACWLERYKETTKEMRSGAVTAATREKVRTAQDVEAVRAA